MKGRGYQLLLAGVTLFMFLVTFLRPKPNGGETTSITPTGKLPTHSQVVRPGGTTQDYVFAFWNLENFFDDQNDGRTGQGDAEYDVWMAERPDIFQLKLQKLTEGILAINDGKGPDILAVCEVESVRAAELLKEALNRRLNNPSLHYTNVLMKEVAVGRHIAAAVITRLPVQRDRTRLLEKKHRVLEAHIVVENKELIVLACHFTSRLTDTTGAQRQKYADLVYGAANAIWHANPAADIIIAGDLNDTPYDPSVTGNLNATGDANALRSTKQLKLFNLFAGKDPNAGFGTIFSRNWATFDQIIVSPGMLDNAGWTCNPSSVRVVNSLAMPSDPQRRPLRFGSRNETGQRGYSDHFPVAVNLRLSK